MDTGETYSFGEWVSQRRKSQHLTQRELAEKAACAVATLKKIEADERRPSPELAAMLADALGIPQDWRDRFVACARGQRPVDILAQMGQDLQTDPSGRQDSAPPVNLPVQSTPFIGRKSELDQIAAHLADPTCRLLTLVGPGGIGKTRLAYQAAATSGNRFRSGAYAVPLAGVDIADHLLPAIAERLKLPVFGGEDLKANLFSYLREKNLLLVLDNLEHLLDGAGLLAEILESAPGVKMLATSRERLNLSAEWLFPVSGLSVPSNDHQGDAEDFTAVQLFEGCARRSLPSFRLDDHLTASIRICELVEGMPLAIELAASWVRQMSCDQIAEQIQRDLSFLSAGWRDVPERHRSIRALFEHSWRLLSTEEQDVLMKLSVFRGGFELEAAQRIAGASLMILSALEDKSLVQGSASGRYDLHELIRQYAEIRLLEDGKADDARDHHLDYFMKWAEHAEEQLHKAEQVAWAQRIRNEYNNLRAALARAFDGGDAYKGLRVTNALWYYWFRWDGNWDEGFKWMEVGLNQTEGIIPIRADNYANAGTLAAQLRNLRTGIDYMQRSFEYSQKLGLAYGIARYAMGMSYIAQEYATVATMLEEAIAILRTSGPPYLLSTALFLYGDRARVQGDLERAQTLYDESLAITQAEQDLMLIAACLERLGRLAAIKGDNEKARAFYTKSGDLFRQTKLPLAIMEFLIPLSALAIYQGDYDTAERHLKEALTICDEYNAIGTRIHATYFRAELALHRQELHKAARLLVESFHLTLSDPEWPNSFANHEFNCERLIIAGKLACAAGDYAEAGWLLSAGETVRAQSGYLLDSLPRAEYEQAVKDVRAHLGDDLFDRVWRAGQALTEEAAVVQAVDYLDAKRSTVL